jgi:hypothetical protein
MGRETTVDPRTNEFVFEFRFKPNAYVFDNRGEWAETLLRDFNLEHWAIDDNSVRLFNKQQSKELVVGFSNAALVARDVETKNYFPELATKMVHSVLNLTNFGSLVLVNRLGVRSRFCTPFSGPFGKLVERFARVYAQPSSSVMKAVGDSARLVDIGAPLNFEDEDGLFNTMCGPMNRDQLKQFFLKKDGLPEVALFFDIDYFQRPAIKMTAGQISPVVVTYASKSWELHERLRDLILRG